MRILVETQVDLSQPWWRKRRQALLQSSTFYRRLAVRSIVVFALLGLILLIAPAIEMDTTFVMATGVALAILYGNAYATIYLQLARLNRTMRRELGDHVTQFVEVTDEGIRFGTRNCSESAVGWKFLDGRVTPTMFIFRISHVSIPLNRDHFEPQKVEQMLYWFARKTGKPDLCRHCNYDLTGSEGPQCPECGRPIRLRAAAVAT